MTTLNERIVEFLKTTPNGMATDWEILCALYPNAKQGDKSNGARMANIRKLARNKNDLHILSNDADMIALTT